jgi:hypothetical protein
VENKLVTSSHMWNLLKLDGSWRVVDVCWADGENGIDYTWFTLAEIALPAAVLGRKN